MAGNVGPQRKGKRAASNEPKGTSKESTMNACVDKLEELKVRYGFSEAGVGSQLHIQPELLDLAFLIVQMTKQSGSSQLSLYPGLCRMGLKWSKT